VFQIVTIIVFHFSEPTGEDKVRQSKLIYRSSDVHRFHNNYNCEKEWDNYLFNHPRILCNYGITDEIYP
jgi:hypothetical protein